MSDIRARMRLRCARLDVIASGAMSETVLRGTEAVTVELDGRLDLARAKSIVGPGLDPEVVDGAALANLFAFRMEGMSVLGVPGPKLDYGELLWRVAVRHGETPAWLCVACDIDAMIVRALGALLVRYPTREARIDVGERRLEGVDPDEGRLVLQLDRREGAVLLDAPGRAMLVRSRGALFRIPWGTDAAAEQWSARVRVEHASLARKTFDADIAWSAVARVMRARPHECGIARSVGG